MALSPDRKHMLLGAVVSAWCGTSFVGALWMMVVLIDDRDLDAAPACQDSVYVVPPEASEVTAYDCAAGQAGTAHVASDGTAIVLCRCPETAP